MTSVNLGGKVHNNWYNRGASDSGKLIFFWAECSRLSLGLLWGGGGYKRWAGEQWAVTWAPFSVKSREANNNHTKW